MVFPASERKTMQSVKLDHDTEILVSRGREAWKSLRTDETWEKWIAIGRALEAGRTAIMRLLHTNQPKGRTWSQVFGAWLEDTDFDKIDKGVRSRLQTCLDNLTEIEAWRQTLGLTLRLQLNHPNAVLRRWQASRADPKKGPSPTGRPGLREEVIRLQSELDAAHRRLEAAEGNDWDWQDTPEDIAAAMLLSHPAKAKRIGAAILAQSKSTAPKPRGQRAKKPRA
jgi:hypothetical protein